MIFGSILESDTNDITVEEVDVMDDDNIKESKYEPDLNGALMCVYENECNFNAIMEAAALSELKYYVKTGGSLFINEAGALSKFFDKIVNFLKKCINKIKELFKKFVIIIQRYTASDAQFVKKYEAILDKAKLDKFTGYKFKKINVDNSFNTDIKFPEVNTSGSRWNRHSGADTGPQDNQIDSFRDRLRGQIVGSRAGLSADEFCDALRDKFYDNEGKKVEIKNVDLKQQLKYISSTEENIEIADKKMKEVTDKINDYIKKVEGWQKEYERKTTYDSAQEEDKEMNVRAMRNQASLYRDAVQYYTTAFGALTQALRDRRRQAKSMCITALTQGVKGKKKNESAIDSDDIFDNVVII